MPSARLSPVDERIDAHRRSVEKASPRRPLHELAPDIAAITNWRPLADGLPTPIVPLEVTGSVIWVKREDLSSTLYGGNKVRKLEYVLGGVAKRYDTIVTGGGNASHHLAASVLYGRMTGLRTRAVMFPQAEPNPAIARLAALLEACDVPVERVPTPYLYPAGVTLALGNAVLRAQRPAFVYPGASSPHGVMGFVDCALEIAEAVAAGESPRPSTIVCALGSGGTSVGLALGLAIAGLPTTVTAVRTADATANNPVVLGAIELGARMLLCRAGVEVGSQMHRLRVLDGYMGEGYGAATEAGTAAQDTAERLGLAAEQTYTAKALAAALDLSVSVHPSSGPIMFLDTAPPVDALVPLIGAGR